MTNPATANDTGQLVVTIANVISSSTTAPTGTSNLFGVTGARPTRSRTPGAVTLHPLDLTREHGERDLDILCCQFDLWAAAHNYVTAGSAANTNPYLCYDDMQVAVTRRHLLSRFSPQISNRIVETRGAASPLRFVQDPNDQHYDRWWKELARSSDIRVTQDELWATFDDTFPELSRGEMTAHTVLLELGRGRILARSRSQIHAIIDEAVSRANACEEELQIAAELLASTAGNYQPEPGTEPDTLDGWDDESLETLTALLTDTIHTARFLLAS